MVKIGDQFRSVFQDGNCLWNVIKKAGRNVWLCEIDREDGDYAGTQKTFMTREIEGSKAWEKKLQQLHGANDDYYKSLTPGQIVHYNDGFKKFIRCQVVQENGENKLKKIALVGAWWEHDLPKRDRRGEIYYPYDAKGVIEGDTFTPNFGNIWERDREGVNPATLPALDLSVPDMTPEEEISAKQWQCLTWIREICEGAKNPEEALDEIKRLLPR